MKISNKLVGINLGVVLLTLIFMIVFNNFFLIEFQKYSKKKVVNEIAKWLQENEINQDEKNYLERKYSIEIYPYKIFKNRKGNLENVRFKRGEKNIEIFSTKVPEVPETEKSIEMKKIKNPTRLTREDLTLIQNGEIVVKESEFMGSKLQILILLASNNELLSIGYSISDLEGVSKISNVLFLLTSLFAFIVSITWTYFFSNRFVKPITNINEITKKITKLDFSEKCKVNSRDEIEELGRNINKLSNELERNISDLKDKNKQLKIEMELDKMQETKRQEFIASVSHEIKTPVTLINTYIESLKDDYVDEEEKKFYYDVIVEEGENIAGLLDKLLTSLENKKDDEVEKKVLNLYELVRGEAEKFKMDLEEKGSRLDLYIDREIDIEFNEDGIKSIFRNLISNAVSYVYDGKSINININNQGEKIVAEVINEGPKIKSLNEVWEPFYREEKSRNRKYGGTGLGLYIVSEQLKREDLDYGVENLENGVKFWFELPKIKKSKNDVG